MRPLSCLILLLALSGCSSGDKQEKPPPPEETVVFEGATAISEGELRELVARDVRRFKADGRATALDDAGFRIEYQYRLEGYDRVRVIPRVEKDHVVFTIEEGQRIHLGFVHFEGATVFKPEELRQLVPGRFLGDAPPYSIRLAIQIEEGIIASYRDRGFADATVLRRAQPDGDRMNLTYVVDEGKPFVVTEIRKLPLDPKLQEKTAAALGRPFTPGTAETIEATIVDYYRENGHPFATARLKPQPDRETGTVVMEADVRDGPDVHIGALNISGTVWSRSGFVANRVDIEPGKLFKSSDLRRAEERLIATNVYKRVRVSPGTFQEETGTVPLDVVLEERETGEAALRGGYGSFEGIRGGADLIGVNIWGGAESIRIGGNISKVGYRGEGDLGVPYLFGSELRLGIQGYYENREYPSYDAISQGGVLSFSYPWSTKLSTTIGLRHADIQTSHVDPSLAEELLDYNYTAMFFTPTLDLRDNALAPTQGILLTGEVAYAPTRRISDIQFWSASGRFSYFFPFPAGIVFATSFQGGVIGPFGGTEEIPIALRYFCGGTNTVRGFKFEAIGPKSSNGDPTGGQVFLALQSEIRFPIWGSLQGAFFSDQGGVWVDRLDVHLRDIRYSVGAGIRFLTPAGALVADLGWNPQAEGREYPTEFHLSVGFPF